MTTVFSSLSNKSDNGKTVIPILLSLSNTSHLTLDEEAKQLREHTTRYMDRYFPTTPYVGWVHGDKRGDGNRGLHVHILAARRDPETGLCHQFDKTQMEEMQSCIWTEGVITSKGQHHDTNWSKAKDKRLEERDKELKSFIIDIARNGITNRIKIKDKRKDGGKLKHASVTYSNNGKSTTWRIDKIASKLAPQVLHALGLHNYAKLATSIFDIASAVTTKQTTVNPHSHKPEDPVKPKVKQITKEDMDKLFGKPKETTQPQPVKPIASNNSSNNGKMKQTAKPVPNPEKIHI